MMAVNINEWEMTRPIKSRTKKKWLVSVHVSNRWAKFCLQSRSATPNALQKKKMTNWNFVSSHTRHYRQNGGLWIQPRFQLRVQIQTHKYKCAQDTDRDCNGNDRTWDPRQTWGQGNKLPHLSGRHCSASSLYDSKYTHHETYALVMVWMDDCDSKVISSTWKNKGCTTSANGTRTH